MMASTQGPVRPRTRPSAIQPRDVAPRPADRVDPPPVPRSDPGIADLQRVTAVEWLRGLAALAVCWYHFTNGGPLVHSGWLRSSGQYGWLGVECFFVVSAFVIPLSLHRGRFTLRTGWRTFLAKRITRLDPPYLVAVAVGVGLAYASAAAPGFTGPRPHFTAAQLLSHLGYLNAVLGYEWVNPVFWTLGVEFQFYLLIALAYPALTARRATVRVAAIIGLAGLSLVPTGAGVVLHYLAVFAIGLATFQRQVGLLNRRTYAGMLVVLVAIAWAAHGPAVAVVAVASSLAIAFVRVSPPPAVRLLGSMSYSLYLFHVPIGGRIVNLGSRFAQSVPAQILVLGSALVASAGVAYLALRYVERPAQRWSASFRYPSA